MIPSVSIVVPVFNTEKYIKQCLDSIIGQTLENIEIICVDNGSTDNSIDIIRKYEKVERNVKVIFHPFGRQGGARNEGVRIARGEYIGFVDSDDFVDENMFKRMYDKVTKCKADMAICGVNLYLDKDRIYVEKDPNILPNCDAVKVADNKLLFRNLTAWNKLYKREFLLKNKIVFPEGLYHEDQFYVTKAYILANKICVLKEPHYFYRKQRDNQVSTLTTEHIFEIFEIFQLLDDFVTGANTYADLQDDVSELKVQRLLYFWSYINERDKKHFFEQMREVFKSISVRDQYAILTKAQYKDYNIVVKYNYHVAFTILKIYELIRRFTRNRII